MLSIATFETRRSHRINSCEMKNTATQFQLNIDTKFSIITGKCRHCVQILTLEFQQKQNEMLIVYSIISQRDNHWAIANVE